LAPPCDVSGHRWQVSRDIIAFLNRIRHPGVEGGAVLAGVKAGALRVTRGQPLTPAGDCRLNGGTGWSEIREESDHD
jgi:hypothetical protein